jgi:4,5-dihydroxyphthalate decarboxylase
VRVEGFALDVVPDPFPPSGLLEDYQARRNLRMTEERAFDIAEMGFAPLLAARSRGLDLVAIPVFHYRRFRHSAIVCRVAAGIRAPADLIGKSVGMRRFSLSAAMWARGLLSDEYGVPLERINWFVQSDTPLRADVRERLNVTIVPVDEPLERWLERGELDATIEAFAIGPLRRSSPLVRPLFERPAAIEIAYYRRSGIFPIMHTIVVWRDLIEHYPELPMRLHSAFAQAKRLGDEAPPGPERYVLAEEERQWLESLTPEERTLFLGDAANRRDPWKYSLKEDRRTIETFLRYAYEQGVAHRRFDVDELFAPSTLDL